VGTINAERGNDKNNGGIPTQSVATIKTTTISNKIVFDVRQITLRNFLMHYYTDQPSQIGLRRNTVAAAYNRLHRSIV